MKIAKACLSESISGYQECTLGELIEQLPRVMMLMSSSSSYPSLEAFNNLLSKGSLDDGMSGGMRWEPLEINESEWMSLKNWLSSRYGVSFKENELLDNIGSFDLWARKSLKFCRK